MKKEATRDELGLGDGVVYRSWLFLMRYVVPIGIVAVFLNLIGVLTF
jgi:NSS family neurotransmitter:Na+ symporter